MAKLLSRLDWKMNLYVTNVTHFKQQLLVLDTDAR